MGLAKRMCIRLEELTEFDSAGGQTWVNTNETKIFGYEYPHLILNREMSHLDVETAYRVLVTYFKQTGINAMILDLRLIENELMPPKKMTLDEIEKELGYKVELVEGEDD